MTLTLAMSMLIASSAVSFAAEGDGYTVTITGNPQDKGTHSYEAYQIFKGNLNETTGALGNLQWGSGISEAGKTALGDAKTYAESMTEENAAEKAAELAQYLTSPEKTGTTSITGLEGGYYLIQDATSSPTGDSAAKTKFILKVIKDETVNVKSSVPTVEKKVQDINDSDTTPTLSSLQDSADYDIGDKIPYTVTATIGTGIDYFESYSMQFADKMSKGLSLIEDTTGADAWSIKLIRTTTSGEGDEATTTDTEVADLTSLFTITSAASTSDKTWTWTATNIMKNGDTAIDVQAGDKVVLTYKCILNKDAVIGSAGNPNEVQLKFDNNPNKSGEGKPAGTTPWDKNIVFTYKTVFNKVENVEETLTAEQYAALSEAEKAKCTEVTADDGTKTYKRMVEQPLVGADFKLEKKVNGEWTDVTTLGSGQNKPSKTGDASGSTFEFKGLDDGDYRLTETTTPPGYNTIDPIVFTITATHDIESANPALTALSGTDGKEFVMTSNLQAGSLTAAIVNEEGAVLPATGGIGTIIFYVLGTLLVVGCGVVLISKKRMENK